MTIWKKLYNDIKVKEYSNIANFSIRNSVETYADEYAHCFSGKLYYKDKIVADYSIFPDGVDWQEVYSPDLLVEFKKNSISKTSKN